VFFRHLLETIPRYTCLEIREFQEIWLILKAHLLNAQEWSILMNRKSSKGSRRPAWINKQLLTQLRYRRGKKGQVIRRNTETLSEHAGIRLGKPKTTCS